MLQSLAGTLKANLGWIVAFGLVILLIVRDAAKAALTSLFVALGRFLYNELAGTRLLRRTAIRRYRTGLAAKHSRVEVPFQPDRTLSMADVYVPLQATRPKRGAVRVDAQAALAAHRRLMVTGAPGSGKSMLMRNWVFAWARRERRGPRTEPIPILLELHRLGGTADPIERQLAAQLARDGFPRAERFLHGALQRGQVRLLLDGLDEVASQHRADVVQRIQDFMYTHARCPVVITCRTAVYEGQFVAQVEATLQVAELDDHLILAFLRRWPGMSDAGPEQLMAILRDAPRIKALARNPLLLHMIAFLYTDVYRETEEALPHTRAEFYRETTDVLLRLHPTLNRYLQRVKRPVLEQLALFSQDSAERDGRDRLSVGYAEALAEVKKVMPNVGKTEAEADDVLTEIVERSGLLLAIDGGERYQFAHLTLQEFFAAQALATDPDGLLARFRADPPTWRETVRLWCGASGRDSTDLIRTLMETDPVLALECVADAARVDDGLASTVIDTMKAQLRSEDEADSVVRAFGLVASSLRPRGQEVFAFLVAQLDALDAASRRAAANALGATNLPRAAEGLAARYSLRPEVRTPLVHLGDLAVPALARLARSGSVAAMDGLHAIGTAAAGAALAGLLWENDEGLASAAAWRLAAVLGRAEVEEALRRADQPVDRRQWLPWIWSPFERPGERSPSALAVVSGRVAHLIKTVPPAGQLPALELDPRIGVPICAVDRRPPEGAIELSPEVQSRLDRRVVPTLTGLARRQAGGDAGVIRDALTSPATADDLRDAIVGDVWRRIWPSDAVREIVARLPARTRYDLVARMVRPRRVIDERDWTNVLGTDEYTFGRSWHFRALLIVSGLLCLPALVEVWNLAHGHLLAWHWVVLVYAVLAIVAFGVVLTISWVGGHWEAYAACAWGPVLLMAALIAPNKSFNTDDDTTSTGEVVATRAFLIVCSGGLPATVLLGTLSALRSVPLAGVVAGWVIVIGVNTLVITLGWRRERDAANPLRGIPLD